MKVLIGYFTTSGKTEQMADYVAEGVRISGHQATIMKLNEIKPEDVRGYEGIMIGSPTFSQDEPHPVKRFLDGLVAVPGKLAGTFGPYRHDVGYSHDTYAPALILRSMEDDLKMTAFNLGPFHLQEESVDTPDGRKACQDYGRVFGEQLSQV